MYTPLMPTTEALTPSERATLARAIADAVESGTDLRTVAEALGLTIPLSVNYTRVAVASDLLNAALAAGRPYAKILEAFALE